MTEKSKKIVSLLGLAAFAGVMVAAFFLIGRPMVDFVKDPAAFQTWRAKQGVLAPLVYLLMVTLQVIVAIIPGEPFELCAGFAFGNVGGTLICLGGILLGSIAVFLPVRRWGPKLLEVFFTPAQIRSVNFLQSARKRNTLVFLLMMIPGTPKDLLTYFVGLTGIRLREWMVISVIARIPSVLSSVVGGNLIAEQQYLFAAIVLVVTALVSLIGLLIYNYVVKKKENEHP